MTIDKEKYDENWDRCFKRVQKDLTELNSDGNEERGRFGEELTDNDIEL
jgi:hypothetical protein